MVTITCPQCGVEISHTLTTGRPKSKATVKNVCDMVKRCNSVRAAAEKLGITRSLAYKRLKEGNYDVKTLFKK